jgi:hypothetical protein
MIPTSLTPPFSSGGVGQTLGSHRVRPRPSAAARALASAQKNAVLRRDHRAPTAPIPTYSGGLPPGVELLRAGDPTEALRSFVRQWERLLAAVGWGRLWDLIEFDPAPPQRPGLSPPHETTQCSGETTGPLLPPVPTYSEASSSWDGVARWGGVARSGGVGCLVRSRRARNGAWRTGPG